MLIGAGPLPRATVCVVPVSRVVVPTRGHRRRSPSRTREEEGGGGATNNVPSARASRGRGPGRAAVARVPGWPEPLHAGRRHGAPAAARLAERARRRRRQRRRRWGERRRVRDAPDPRALLWVGTGGADLGQRELRGEKAPPPRHSRVVHRVFCVKGDARACCRRTPNNKKLEKLKGWCCFTCHERRARTESAPSRQKA